jgi:mRNA-degrading endonuclease YafQ of YafQ-DinJ toxin-antitoxin module
MIQVRESPAFQRSYKKLIKGKPDLQKKFRERLALFIANPYDPLLETHKLKGKMKKFWAFSLNHSLRVAFVFEDSNSVRLENVGPHDDVYK